MSLFRAIDDVLFDRLFQPFVNRLHWLAAPKDIALFFLSGDILALLVQVFVRWRALDWAGMLFSGASAVLCAFYYIQISWFPPNARLGTRNPWRISPKMMFCRFLFLLGVVVALPYIAPGGSTIMRLDGLDQFLGVVTLYILACDKPPPSVSKRRLFWGNLAWGRR